MARYRGLMSGPNCACRAKASGLEKRLKNIPKVLKFPARILATRLGIASSSDTPAKSQKLSRYIRKVSSSSSETCSGRSLRARGAGEPDGGDAADGAGVPGCNTLEGGGA